MANINKIHDHEHGTVYSITSFAKPAPKDTTRKPRTRSMKATSDCKVTRADGTSYTIPKYTRKEATPAHARELELRAIARRREAMNRRVDIQNALDQRSLRKSASGIAGYIGNID